MGRPYLLAAAFALVFALAISEVAHAASAAGRLEFEILRGGRPFGRQGVTVSVRDGALHAETSADLQARLGPISLFSYTQRCSESWRNGALVALQCLTRQNGHSKNVEGALNAGALRVSGTQGLVAFGPGTLPTSWWTRPPLSTREMINTETGARLPVRVTLVGRETIVANGTRIQADHIRVQGTLAVDLWYDEAGHWVSCAFTAGDEHMTYRLLTRPADGPA